MTTLKAALAQRLRERFSLDEVVDATEQVLRGATVRKKYKVHTDKDGNERRMLVEVVESVKPEDAAKGLIILDAVAFEGELGMSPRQVQGGNMSDLYKRFNAPVDNRIVQLPDKKE